MHEKPDIIAESKKVRKTVKRRTCKFFNLVYPNVTIRGSLILYYTNASSRWHGSEM